MLLLFVLALLLQQHSSEALSPPSAQFWGPIPSLRLFWPHSRAAVDAYLEEKRDAPFNHAHSGRSCGGDGDVPAGFQELSVSVVVGQGPRAHRRATAAMHALEMVNALPWAKAVTPSKGKVNEHQPRRRLAPGAVLCTLVRCYGVAWSLNPCRVVRSDPHQLAYTTVDGHLIAGEERFRVDWGAARSGGGGGSDVVFTVYSFTKGAGVVGALAMPFIRPIQRRFFRDMAAAMQRIVADGQ